MKDRYKRLYATENNTKVGDVIQVDGDFTCMEPWTVTKVQEDEGGLYILCNDGHHYLAGQLDEDDGCYVGIYHIHMRGMS